MDEDLYMNGNGELISQKSLKAGDVILCYKNSKLDLVGKKIKKTTGSDYTHAAICLDNEIAAESIKSGVQKVSITSLISHYHHVAVFRQPDAWDSDREKSLNLFIGKVTETKTKYNFSGVLKFKKNKESHQDTLYEQLSKFYDNPDLSFTKKEKYFCSELVVESLVETEFISPSAAVLYKPDTMSPGDLGKDPTFGTFYGYISTEKNYTVPIDDEFYWNGRYQDIFK